MADLESLTNKQLHDMCIQNGLPNIPVTDTSRKIIIRRLANALSGEKTEKPKGRRETIHVVHVEKEDTSKKVKKPPGRRTTLAASQEKQSVVASKVEESAIPAPIETRRRSMRSSPLPQDAEPFKPVSRIPKPTPVIQEDNEDDVLFVSEERIDQDRNRKSRSPSLSKSEVVKTYYKSSVVAEPTIEEQNDYDDDDYEPVPPIVTSRQPRYSPQLILNRISPAKSTNVRTDMEQFSLEDPNRKSTLYSDLRAQLETFDENYETSTYSQPARSSVEQRTYDDTNVNTYSSYIPKYSSDTASSYLNRKTTSYREPVSSYSEIPSEYSRTYGDKGTSSSTITNRRLTSNFQPRSTYCSGGIGSSRRIYNEHSDDNGDDDDILEPSEEPKHFRDFAQRLSVLRDQEITNILSKDKKDVRSGVDYRYSSKYGQKESSVDRVVGHWTSLDQKYHVTRNLIIISSIFFVAFIYIFFAN